MPAVKILGTGSGVPTLDHWPSSTALTIDGFTYLLDAGAPLGPMMLSETVARFYHVRRTAAQTRRDRKFYVDMYSVLAIFLSHLHADHVFGLPYLLQAAHLWEKRGDEFRFPDGNTLRVYMPRMGLQVFREFLEMIGLGEPRFNLRMLPILEGEFYRDERIAVVAVPNTHRLGTSYSFSIRAGKKSIVYTGDIRLDDLSRPGLLEGRVDLLIVECAHFEPLELFEALKGADIHRVILTHLHPSLYGRLREVERLGRKLLGKRLVVATDGLEVEI